MLGGIALALLVGALMLRRPLRLPALLVGLLAIPGNVDNLMPQMRLDPHRLANDTAPAVSIVDLLILWALVLTVVEGGRPVHDRFERASLVVAVLTVAAAATSAVIATMNGVDVGASVRGTLIFVRIAAILLLAVMLKDVMRGGRLLTAAAVIAGVALLANGLYTSTMNDEIRFTASTLGRNGFSLALVLASVASGGYALHSSRIESGARWLTIPAGTTACACLFGAVATGTRMSLLALVPAVVIGLLLIRFWALPGGVPRVAAALVLMVASVGAAGVWSSEGGRAVSAVTDFSDTVDIITNPEGQPDYSPVRSRTYFWRLAMGMAADHPVVGVGPFQWNFERYERDPESVRVVADAHNTYLQTAAEYGLPALAGYVALLIIAASGILHAVWLRRKPLTFPIGAILVCALIYPVTELTNSHLYNVRMGPTGWLFIACALVIMRSTLVRSATSHEASGVMPKAAPG